MKRGLDQLRKHLVRYGMVWTLPVLVGHLQGASISASPALCTALDTSLPGPGCSMVPAATQTTAAVPLSLGAPLTLLIPVGIAISAMALVVGSWLGEFTQAAIIEPAPATAPATAPISRSTTPAIPAEEHNPAEAPVRTHASVLEALAPNEDTIRSNLARERAHFVVKEIKQEDGHWEVEGKQDDHEIELVFDHTGKLLHEEREVDLGDVPPAVLSALQHYPGLEIQEIKQRTVNGVTTWIIEGERDDRETEIIATNDGTVLRAPNNAPAPTTGANSF